MKSVEQRAMKAQKEYCERTGCPMFVPSDGICFGCKRQIFGNGSGQISEKRASQELITGCPSCGITFCD